MLIGCDVLVKTADADPLKLLLSLSFKLEDLELLVEVLAGEFGNTDGSRLTLVASSSLLR